MPHNICRGTHVAVYTWLPLQVFDDAVIKRIDPGLGLLLQLPLQPTPGAAFAHVSNISDGDRVDKLEKRFKVGESVRARVVGFRLLDGLSVVSLKESVIKRQVRPQNPGPGVGNLALREEVRPSLCLLPIACCHVQSVVQVSLCFLGVEQGWVVLANAACAVQWCFYSVCLSWPVMVCVVITAWQSCLLYHMYQLICCVTTTSWCLMPAEQSH